MSLGISLLQDFSVHLITITLLLRSKFKLVILLDMEIFLVTVKVAAVVVTPLLATLFVEPLLAVLAHVVSTMVLSWISKDHEHGDERS